MKAIKNLNIFLFIIAAILLVNLARPLFDGDFNGITGASTYEITDEFTCAFNNEEGLFEIPTNSCCYEIAKQYKCENIILEDFNIKCYNDKNSEKYFLLDKETLEYCQNQGYDVSINK